MASPTPATGSILVATMTVADTKRRWTSTCVGKRQPTAAADFGAVAGEANDAVEISCRIVGSGSAWSMAAHGKLDRNFGGTLSRVDDPDGEPLRVQVVMWMELFSTFHRHLPDPVGRIRSRTESWRR